MNLHGHITSHREHRFHWLTLVVGHPVGLHKCNIDRGSQELKNVCLAIVDRLKWLIHVENLFQELECVTTWLLEVDKQFNLCAPGGLLGMEMVCELFCFGEGMQIKNCWLTDKEVLGKSQQDCNSYLMWELCPAELSLSPKMRINLPRHDLLGEKRLTSLRGERSWASLSIGFYWV